MEDKFDNEKYRAEVEALEPLTVSMRGLTRVIESARAFEEQARLYSESKSLEKKNSDKWVELTLLEGHARFRARLIYSSLGALFPDGEHKEIPSRPLEEFFDYH